ncbi:Hypothetical predicted protein [Pelobates cultripes]|uniref:Uncharacterized protein n=1 Tax=Pelobates cultripes TaxID=61616 RepID=A0AAD1RP75_PELCU|nr:Hypothetical predicted protein [Pelobates cultripes]
MDTSMGTSTLPGHVLRGMRETLHEFQLSDCWSVLHHADKDYSYYSPPHKSYSRTDYFFITHRHLDDLHSATIAPIIWLDHVPIIIMLTSRKQWVWRLNKSLLEDALLKAEIEDQLEHFFLENTPRDSNPETIWETHKCAIRGTLIRQANAISTPERHPRRRGEGIRQGRLAFPV